jgi:hypothetical protein
MGEPGRAALHEQEDAAVLCAGPMMSDAIRVGRFRPGTEAEAVDAEGSGAARRHVAVAPSHVGLVVAAAVAATAVAGCAGLQQPEVEQVAAAFTQSGAAERCALLAPTTVTALEHDESVPCADALGQLDLPGGRVVSSVVWGDNAQVRLTGDSLFLTRTDTGWKVAAAGCTPRGDAPYLCRLEA